MGGSVGTDGNGVGGVETGGCVETGVTVGTGVIVGACVGSFGGIVISQGVSVLVGGTSVRIFGVGEGNVVGTVKFIPLSILITASQQVE